MTTLHEQVAGIQNKADLIAFIDALSHDLETDPARWENVTLERYLFALARWLEDCEGYYRNQNRVVPENPSWRNIGEMLAAARVYE